MMKKRIYVSMLLIILILPSIVAAQVPYTKEELDNLYLGCSYWESSELNENWGSCVNEFKSKLKTDTKIREIGLALIDAVKEHGTTDKERQEGYIPCWRACYDAQHDSSNKMRLRYGDLYYPYTPSCYLACQEKYGLWLRENYKPSEMDDQISSAFSGMVDMYRKFFYREKGPPRGVYIFDYSNEEIEDILSAYYSNLIACDIGATAQEGINNLDSCAKPFLDKTSQYPELSEKAKKLVGSYKRYQSSELTVSEKSHQCMHESGIKEIECSGEKSRKEVARDQEFGYDEFSCSISFTDFNDCHDKFPSTVDKYEGAAGSSSLYDIEHEFMDALFAQEWAEKKTEEDTLAPGKIAEGEQELKLEIIKEIRHGFRNKLKLSRGQMEMLRDGKVSPVTTDLELSAGDVIRTGDDSSAEIVSGDSTIKLGEDTTLEFVGLPFDPVPDRRIVPPEKAPWALDRSKHEIDDPAFWWGFWNGLKEHVPKLLFDCMLTYGGLFDPLHPDIPLPPLAGCARQHMVFLFDGTLWSESKPQPKESPNVTIELMMTRHYSFLHMATEFSVEVADEKTTLTVIDGSVLMTDLTSMNSVIVGANEQLTVTSDGLGEEELQQSITTIDPKSIDRWWTKEAGVPIGERLFAGFIIIGIPLILLVLIIWLIVKKFRRVCPKCKTRLRFFRILKNFRQIMTGGQTCSKCGAELNWKGEIVGKGKSVSKIWKCLHWVYTICIIIVGLSLMVIPEVNKTVSVIITLFGIVLLPPVISRLIKRKK